MKTKEVIISITYIIFSVFLLFLLHGCGSKTTEYLNYNTCPSNLVCSTKHTYQGYHSLPYGGYLELSEDFYGRVTVENSNILTENKDNTIGAIPLSGSDYIPLSDRLIIKPIITYGSTNLIKTDSGNSLLSGNNYETTFVITKFNGKITINILIRNKTNGNMEVDRIIKEA